MNNCCRLLTVTAALLGQVALAQDLRGTVLDSASGRPIQGAVVQTLDANGRALARAATNESGQYRVRLAAEASRLRLLRLGFRPREVTVPAQRADSMLLDLRMVAIPQMLEPVRAVANRLCPRRADREAAFGFWQQAKAGLLTTIVMRDENPFFARTLLYQRFLGQRDNIEQQRVQAASGTWSIAFGAALSAAEFTRTGFTTMLPDSNRVFFGPDAEILLEEEFQSTYCFSLAARRAERPTQVGLRFTPARRVMSRVDIDGTLWIDTAKRVLTDIEFVYVGLEAGADRYRPGGVIAFHEMPNGIVLVNRWSLRMVSRIVLQGPGGRRRGPGNFDEFQFRQFAVTDGGGELAHARWPDGTTYAAPLGRVRIRTITRDGTPVPKVAIQLDSTDYVGTTDSLGFLEIGELLPGPYSARFVDPTLAAIGLKLETPLKFVASRDSTIDLEVEVTTAQMALAAACDDKAYRNGYHLFVARVVAPDGKPIEGVKWAVERHNGINITGEAKANGVVLPCGHFSPNEEIQLSVWTGKGAYTSTAPRKVVVVLEKPATAVRVVLDP